MNWFDPNRTLEEAISKPGGKSGLGTLAFHVVAGQLNINSPDVAYGYTQAEFDAIIASVIDPTDKAQVTAALALIAAANEAGCPNAGTFTVPGDV